MSSSRSVAAARARRANESSSQSAFKPQNTQHMQQSQLNASGSKQPMTPYQPKESSIENKLTVSDAFALVTLRLGRVELLLQKWQGMGVESESGVRIPVSTSSTPDVNNTMVKSLVSRIDDLERDLKSFVSTKDIESTISMLSEKNLQLQNELRDAKNAIYKLQSMTLDTSQKIMTMMMAKTIPAVKESLTIEIPEHEYNADSARSEDLEQLDAELKADGQDEQEGGEGKEGGEDQEVQEEIVENAEN